MKLTHRLALAAALGLTAAGTLSALAADSTSPPPDTEVAIEDAALLESIVVDLDALFAPPRSDKECEDFDSNEDCEKSKDPPLCWECKGIRVCCVMEP